MTAVPEVVPRGDRRIAATRVALLRRVSDEFAEMPCLRLTAPQARRLFGLRQDICERVLATLVHEGALEYGLDGQYRRRNSGTGPAAHVDRRYLPMSIAT